MIRAALDHAGRGGPIEALSSGPRDFDRLPRNSGWRFMLLAHMDRDMLLRHLAGAERRAANGARHLELQRRLLQGLRRDRHDTHRATELLRTFEESQAMDLTDLARIRAQLAQSG